MRFAAAGLARSRFEDRVEPFFGEDLLRRYLASMKKDYDKDKTGCGDANPKEEE